MSQSSPPVASSRLSAIVDAHPSGNVNAVTSGIRVPRYGTSPRKPLELRESYGLYTSLSFAFGQHRHVACIG